MALDSGKLQQSQIYRKWVFCFLSFFFILYWLPDIANFPFYNCFAFLTYKNFNYLQYIWVPETNVIFAGHHHPSPPFIWEADIPLAYEALIATVILSIILSAVVIAIDKKYHFLTQLQLKTYPYFYVLTAKLTSIFMFIGGLAKLVPLQFSQIAFSPDNMMLPTGSSNAYPLLWIAFGSSEYYEMILGALEIMGAILLWIPRTTVIGAILTSIVMLNVVLIDIFGNTKILIIPILLLLTCIFLFWAEVKHFLRYCTHGTAQTHTVPVYSLAQNTSRIRLRRIFRCISAMSGILVIIFYSYEMLEIYHDHQHSYTDPFYGVWDNTIPGIYIGNYPLQTIGIINHDNQSEISLYTFNGNGVPEDISGTYKDHQVFFSIKNSRKENIAFSANISPKGELILHFIDAGQNREYHYRHRAAVSRRQLPHVEL